MKNVGLRATGVVRADRIQEKNEIDKKAPKGTYVAKHDKDSGINYITARDSKNVSLLSSAAGVTPLTPIKRSVKGKSKKDNVDFPNVFSKYNKFMGGVDIHDQHCNKFLPSIRSKKWPWVLFLRIVQASLTNALVLYNTVRDKKNKISAKTVALEVSKEYLRPKNTNFTKHSFILSKSQNKCSTEKCPIRTYKLCEVCQLYFCQKCYEKSEGCMGKAIRKQKSAQQSQILEEKHQMINSKRKIYCRNYDLCKVRTPRFCQTCQFYLCKKCSEQKHK